MADATPIENISLNFTSEYESASKGIDKVIGKLAELQRRIDKTSVTIKIKGVENLKQAADSTNEIDESSISKLERLTDALVRLSGVNIPDSIPNRLKSINKALKTEGISGIEKAANAVDDIVTETTTVTDTTAVSNPIEEMGVAAETYAPNFTMVAEKLSAISTASKPLSGLLSASAESLGEFGGALESIASSKPIGSYFEDLQNSMAVSGKIEAVSSSLKMAAQDMQEMKIQAGADTAFQGYVSNLTQMSQANQVFYDSAEKVNDVISRIVKTAEPIPQIAGLLPEKSLASTRLPYSPLTMETKAYEQPAPSELFAGLQTDAVEPIRALQAEVIKLPVALNNAEKAFDGAKESIKKFGESAMAFSDKHIFRGFKAMGKEIVENTKKTFGATSAFNKLLGSIKRVALYRAIRAGIKAISNGFKEGVSNLYKWSDAFDKTREFANSMDKIATAVLYVKNSLGALVAPIINAVAPAIDFLADKFVWLLNIINEFIAALTGAATFTVAKKIPTHFEDVSKGASKAAKALKSYTLGIDELNIIEDNAGSRGGGAGIANNVEDWFEKKAVSQSAQDLADKVRKIAETIRGYLEYAFSAEAYEDFMDFLDYFKGGEWLAPIGEYFMEDLPAAIGAIAWSMTPFETFRTSLANIKKGLDIIWAIITDPQFTNAMFDLFTPLKGWDWIVDEVLDGINKALEVLSNAFKNATKKVKKFVELIGILLNTDPKNWFSAIKNFNWGEEGTNDATEYTKSMEKTMREKNPIKGVFDSMEKEASRSGKNSGKNYDTAMVEGIASKSSLITSKIASVTSSATSGLNKGSLYNSAKKTGQNIVDGILKGITDKQAELIKNAQNTAADILKAVNKKLGIKSPSREFMKTGRYIVEGLNIGISENASSTQKVLDNWAKDITIDPSNISMPSVGDIVDEVQGYIATAGTMAVTSEDKSLDQFMEETLMPILSNIAVDTKRQADKKETSEVYLDNRKVTSAVNRQNRANGFSFT